MTSLEDKLLGEKQDYYCSSSEDEAEGKLEVVKEEDEQKNRPLNVVKFDRSSNTGPKGVVKDYQRYKQLEMERHVENEAERLALMKKLSLGCMSSSEEEQALKNGEVLDEQLNELMLEYISLRMQEMVSTEQNVKWPRFGSLVIINSKEAFLDAIDREHKDTTVIIHLYTPFSPGCDTMNACLNTLAEAYPFHKFCVMSTETAGMTSFFEINGVPALTIYRGRNLIGSFVSLASEFGEDFVSTDVESFLIEHGFLPDPSTVPKVIRGKQGSQEDEEDDDDDDDDGGDDDEDD